MQRTSAPNFHMVLISQKNKTDYSSGKAQTTISSLTQCLEYLSRPLKGDCHPDPLVLHVARSDTCQLFHWFFSLLSNFCLYCHFYHCL